MTVSSVVVRAVAGWTGAETEFPTGIQVLAKSQLVVSLVPDEGSRLPLTLGLHYTVVLSPAGVATVVPLPVFPAVPGEVSFVRHTPMTQDYDPTATDTYDAAGHAAALDRSAMRVAELSQAVDDIAAASVVISGGAASVPEGAVYVSDGAGRAVAGPTAAQIEAARVEAIGAAGTATGAAGAAIGAATTANQAAERAEAAATSVEGYVSFEDEQDLTTEQRARALDNLGLEGLQNALTPFGFTATAGQTAFDLGMSPLPNACIFSLNGAWLVGGGVDYTIAGSTLTLATPATAGDHIAGVAIASFTVANAMLSAANLADLADKAVARGNLGLGSAAVLNAGTGANEVLKLDGTGKLPAVDGGQITGIGWKRLAAVASTAGTFVEFVIPTSAKRLVVEFAGVSTNGSSSLLVQLGSGTLQVGGYSGTSIAADNGGAGAGVSSTAGFPVLSNSAASLVSGHMTIDNVAGNQWVASQVAKYSPVQASFGGGDVALAGALDRLRVTTVNGTDVFDAGIINVLWE